MNAEAYGFRREASGQYVPQQLIISYVHDTILLLVWGCSTVIGTVCECDPLLLATVDLKADWRRYRKTSEESRPQALVTLTTFSVLVSHLLPHVRGAGQV